MHVSVDHCHELEFLSHVWVESCEWVARVSAGFYIVPWHAPRIAVWCNVCVILLGAAAGAGAGARLAVRPQPRVEPLHASKIYDQPFMPEYRRILFCSTFLVLNLRTAYTLLFLVSFYCIMKIDIEQGHKIHKWLSLQWTLLDIINRYYMH